MLNRSASLAMSTSVLKALPGKLDIKRHSPSILYLQPFQGMSFQIAWKFSLHSSVNLGTFSRVSLSLIFSLSYVGTQKDRLNETVLKQMFKLMNKKMNTIVCKNAFILIYLLQYTLEATANNNFYFR